MANYNADMQSAANGNDSLKPFKEGHHPELHHRGGHQGKHRHHRNGRIRWWTGAEATGGPHSGMPIGW